MRFEWDAKKDRLNRQKHDDIDFALASLVFEDPYCVLYPDRIDLETGEQRWHALGNASIEPGFQITSASGACISRGRKLWRQNPYHLSPAG
ncbi:MAG TPA: BrnT family toxin [Bryobacteraceae bacterium]|jgi:uncharacterized DUF497 family protein